MGYHRPMRSVEERFWEKVDRSGDCWLWIGTKDKHYDYGRFRIGTKSTDKKERAHRVAWMLIFGPIPDGMWVLHHCDRPACVRPEHLFLGTNSMNQKDAYRKGKHDYLHKQGRNSGEKNGSSRLTKEQVLEIRTSHKSQYALAKRFGISQPAISYIRS